MERYNLNKQREYVNNAPDSISCNFKGETLSIRLDDSKLAMMSLLDRAEERMNGWAEYCEQQEALRTVESNVVTISWFSRLKRAVAVVATAILPI